MIFLDGRDPRYARVAPMWMADHRAELGGGGPQTCDGYDLAAARDVRGPGAPIVAGIAYRGDLTTLYGASGTGKSALVAALARAVLDGDDLVGRRATRGRVLYIAPELGAMYS
ncbi:MAG: AAA family ATPase, partial [Planctomycetes bacterium]|nr:AAA family ATPase [Planctomycetota bacterium]